MARGDHHRRRHAQFGTCIDANSHALARYAALCQEAGIVPMVEPEVLMDGDHDIDVCYDVTEATLRSLFAALYEHNVMLEGTILKASMVVSGKDCPEQAGVEEVAEVHHALPEVHGAGGRCRASCSCPAARATSDATAHLERDEPDGPASVAAVVLLRPRDAVAPR